jgi:four helix bundle protein
VKLGNEDGRFGSWEVFKELCWQGNCMEEERWQKLEVWKVSDDLAYRVCQETKTFPKEEIYGLTSQIRRLALSIPTNVVEGYSRKGDKELSRFINISLGSLAETNTFYIFRID